jgi:hypothetical protein
VESQLVFSYKTAEAPVTSHNTIVQLPLNKQTEQTNSLTDYLIAKQSETINLGNILDANFICLRSGGLLPEHKEDVDQ